MSGENRMNKYEVQIKETADGELFFNLPEELMRELEWKEGDELKFIEKENRQIQIKKVKYETIELDFDDDELFKYMKLAHENNMSFNEWIEHSLKEIIEQNK
jgi:bifunctional DNA-binding transcriptional regulator/antitoxin component of YhaV-PrlF toxin-antitoxin module